MVRDQFGRGMVEEAELIEQLYKDPEFDLTRAVLETTARERYNQSIAALHLKDPALRGLEVLPLEWTVEDFDQHNQSKWHMPERYQKLDVWEHLAVRMSELSQRGEFGSEHLDRVLEEMGMFEDRGLIPLLRYLIYFVDTMRDKGVLWGVGRGSSVASYVLYLIGVHRIDSFKYNLSIQEFLK